MAAPRKNPPSNAADTIRQLTEKGISNVGIAMEFKVSKETLKRWLDDNPQLQEAFEQGREIERQSLHAAVYRSAIEGKPANVNAFFLLKARFGYVEADNRSTNINVGVTVTPAVMVVTDHGTDTQWAAKSKAQQAALVLDAGSPPKTLPAPKADIEDAIIVPSQIVSEKEYPAWMPVQFRKPTVPESEPQYSEANNGQPQPPPPTEPLVWRQNS